jgi:hypothetical protein
VSALGQREQAQSEFFRQGGLADAFNRAPSPIRIPQHPASSPQTHSNQQSHTPRRSQRRQDQRRCQPTIPTNTLPSFLPNNKPTHSSLLPFSTMLEAFRRSPTPPVAGAAADGGGAGGSSQVRGACSVLRGKAGEPSGAGPGGGDKGSRGYWLSRRMSRVSSPSGTIWANSVSLGMGGEGGGEEEMRRRVK